MIRYAARVIALAITLFVHPAAWAQGPREFRGAPPGDFDYYLLALSWSPTFCAFEGGRRDPEQCDPGRRLGFVVHGLWPQLERGRLEHCETVNRSPSRLALEEADGVFPSEGLARHQWRKHGTCARTSPADYFRDVKQARDRLRVPDLFENASGGDQRMTSRDVERAFATLNPGLRPDMMTVTCRRGRLQEVRICFERDLRGFRTCHRDEDRCPIGEITVTGAP